MTGEDAYKFIMESLKYNENPSAHDIGMAVYQIARLWVGEEFEENNIKRVVFETIHWSKSANLK